MSHEFIFQSEEDTMKNEIPADIFLVPPPPRLRKNFTKLLKILLHTFLVFIHATQFFNYKTVHRILQIV